MMIPQIVATVITGAIVSQWGYYVRHCISINYFQVLLKLTFHHQVPYMIAGAVISSVGAGLLTTIGPATSDVEWAAYLALTGFGIGMTLQLPYTAVQVVLE